MNPTTTSTGLILWPDQPAAYQYALARYVMTRRRQRVHQVQTSAGLWWHVRAVGGVA